MDFAKAGTCYAYMGAAVGAFSFLAHICNIRRSPAYELARATNRDVTKFRITINLIGTSVCRGIIHGLLWPVVAIGLVKESVSSDGNIQRVFIPSARAADELKKISRAY